MKRLLPLNAWERNGSEEANRFLIEHKNLRLVVYIAKNLIIRAWEEDLISIGTIGPRHINTFGAGEKDQACHLCFPLH